MKTLKNLFGFLIISVLFCAPVSGDNLAFSETPIDYSIKQDDAIQILSHLEMFLYINTETQSPVNRAPPDTFPLAFDDNLEKRDGFLCKNQLLTQDQSFKFHNYNRDCTYRSFIKEIISPFHFFW